MSVAASRQVEIGHHVVTAGQAFGDWELPGQGEASGRCGEMGPVGFCDSAGHIEFGAHRCQRRECPDCWSSQWAGPRTVNVASRLAAARTVAGSAAGKRAIHAVVSPPPGDVPNTIAGFYQGRRRANEIAKEHGIRGGVVVAHGYRPTVDAKDEYREGAPEKKVWRWIREHERPWRELVAWSPHYHVIGLADRESLDPSTGQPGHIEPGDDRADGWIFKNIRSLDRYNGPGDMEGMEDMVGVVRYLLSHATFPADENRQAVTWFGALHGTNFNPEEALTLTAWRRIQADAEQLVGAPADEPGEGELPGCSVDGCDGRVHDILEARAFLETAGGSIPEAMQRRIVTAYEWRVGRAIPPPGLARPGSEEEARETLEAMLPTGPL